MKRDLQAFGGHTYDVIIIGGGIYGACIAWEATLRGLQVALFEQWDFGSATSANSLKVIHGGLRYLQHGNLQRLRASTQERNRLIAIAPHLIAWLPALIPAYGHGVRGQEVFRLAALLNNVVCNDINRTSAELSSVPQARFLSSEECLRLIPELPTDGLTGGLMAYDAQVFNSERLILSFLQSAVFRGADVANYAQVTGFLTVGNAVRGVTVYDQIHGDSFEVFGDIVINTAGPWVSELLRTINPFMPAAMPTFIKAVNIVVKGLPLDYALGIRSRASRRHRLQPMQAQRMLFAAPWRNRSIIGTSYSAIATDQTTATVTTEDISTLIDDFNEAYPAASLTTDNVCFAHAGLLPESPSRSQSREIQPAAKLMLRDHRKDGILNLLSVVGEKYTTARLAAEVTVNRVFAYRGKRPPPSRSATTPLHDGNIEHFETFLRDELAALTPYFPCVDLHEFARDYGTALGQVLQHYDRDQRSREGSPFSDGLLKARTRYAVESECAYHLTDVLFRRTGVGTTGYPGDHTLMICAHEMADLCGWDDTRITEEVVTVLRYYADKGSYVHAYAGTPVDKTVLEVSP